MFQATPPKTGVVSTCTVPRADVAVRVLHARPPGLHGVDAVEVEDLAPGCDDVPDAQVAVGDRELDPEVAPVDLARGAEQQDRVVDAVQVRGEQVAVRLVGLDEDVGHVHAGPAAAELDAR
jgi:hypothetical protein